MSSPPPAAFLQLHDPGVALGCTNSSTVYARTDKRTQYRADFEWSLDNHLLRFGFDHEKNVSDYARHYTGPGEFYYNLYAAPAGSTISNGGVVPAGYDAYIRARQYEIAGTFPTIDSALLCGGQLVGHAEPGAEHRRAQRQFRQPGCLRSQLHQDQQADRAAAGFLVGRPGRRQHEGVRQPGPLLPAGCQRHQHQAGGRAARPAHLLRL